jgi:erythronate-4-phosphate dehydrogenase
VKILVDENVPFGRELFGSLGEVTLAAGREVDEGFPGLEEFDVLVIRSVTRVTPALVARAVTLKVIGTATIGTDHIDLDCIARANRTRENPLSVVAAPGSNADSVADYVWHAVAWLTRDSARPLSDMSMGIIGCGNCGSRVARRAEGFGMGVLRNDPPLAEQCPEFQSDALEEVLRGDFVTLHVPLTRKGEGTHPTYHMIGSAELGRMRPSAYFINSSRGAAVESGALMAALRSGVIAGAVLDVFEGEPEPLSELISLPAIATPHIAGYAVEAKRRGAVVIYEHVCRRFGVAPMDAAPLLMRGFRPPLRESVEFDARGGPALAADNALRALLAHTHDIAATSRELKATLASGRRGELFDRMRKDYERDCGRRELASYNVSFGGAMDPDLRPAIGERLAGFGIQVSERDPHYVLRPR